MKIEREDVWTLSDIYNNAVVCITTNGHVTSKGNGVMGRGIALQAKLRCPMLERRLGILIRQNGNIVQELYDGILAFPVKHTWSQKASVDLIAKSTKALCDIANVNNDKIYLLPAPGTGNGCLKWSDIKELMETLPDNVIIVSKEDIFND